MQAQQVGQIAAAADECLLQEPPVDEARIGRIEDQVVAADEVAHSSGVLMQQRMLQLAAAGERLQRHRPQDEIGLGSCQRLVQQQQIFGQRHHRIAEVVDDDATAVGGAQIEGVELPGQRVVVGQEPAPGGGIADEQHAKLVGRRRPGDGVAGEHGRQVVERQVVILGGNLAIGQAKTAGIGNVIERQAAEGVQRPDGGEDRVEQEEQDGRFDGDAADQGPVDGGRGFSGGD